MANYGIMDKNGMWKGDNAGYTAIHMWVARHFGKPTACENCGTKTGRIEWSNISGLYKRLRNDWWQLCVKCHKAFDNHGAKVSKALTGRPKSSKHIEKIRENKKIEILTRKRDELGRLLPIRAKGLQ